MNRPKATAVIVAYRARDIIEKTAAVLQRNYEGGLLACVIVDNDSRDGTVDFLREHHPWMTIVPSQTNVGFGRGCNLGARLATTPYLLFLNPDADLEAAAIVTLVDFLDHHPEAGLAAPAIVDPDGQLQTTGDLPTPWTILRAAAGHGLSKVIQPGAAPFQVQWVCGAAFMIRTSLFESLGGFDPRYFLYFEETDLCRRALRSGAQIWAVGQAVARHIDGAIAKRSGQKLFQGCIARHYFESRFYYLSKHHGRLAAALADLGELIILSLRAVPRWLLGSGNESLRIRLRSPILRPPTLPTD